MCFPPGKILGTALPSLVTKSNEEKREREREREREGERGREGERERERGAKKVKVNKVKNDKGEG